MNLNSFKTSATAEQEGVWVEFDGARFLIARLNNSKHAAGFAQLLRPFRGAKIPEDKQRELMIESMADHILLGWEGVTNDGKPFPYTRENAVIALKIPDFADQITVFARDMELFRAQETAAAVEALAKNSSGGPSGGATSNG
jgi:hypothetical protein